jgi:Fe-S-cluster-containing dehydrogenase component
VILKDGTFLADSPMGARDGFTSMEVQEKKINPDDIAKAFFVPKLCNQCEKPPCVQVCPVGATYQRADGVVLVDRSWCIGCGYCIMACPYGVRFFHPVYRTAEKCTFCIHRLVKGMKTACVQACPFGARQVGNLKDPNDPVTKTVLTQRVAVLKDEYGTQPQVYYLGLDEHVR